MVWILVDKLEHLWEPERLAYVSPTMMTSLLHGFLNLRMESFDAPFDDGDQSQAAQCCPKVNQLRIAQGSASGKELQQLPHTRTTLQEHTSYMMRLAVGNSLIQRQARGG
eukprot:8021851-Pyramimonas_sp.AAC.3